MNELMQALYTYLIDYQLEDYYGGRSGTRLAVSCGSSWGRNSGSCWRRSSGPTTVPSCRSWRPCSLQALTSARPWRSPTRPRKPQSSQDIPSKSSF